MTWTIKYRKQSGEVATLNIEAASKEDVWPILKQRGISAIAVNRADGKVRSKNPTGKSFKYFVVLFCLIILGIGVALIFKTTDSVADSTIEKTPSQIATFTPAVSTKTQVVPEPLEEPVVEIVPTTTDRWGNVWQGKRPVYQFKQKPVVIDSRQDNIEQVLFSNSCDIAIAQLMLIEPGEMLFGSVTYGDKFREDFKNHFLERAEIYPDDSDYIKALKNAVNETKAELARRVRNGEDPALIVTESREELVRLGNYKNALKEELLELAKQDTYTDEELSELKAGADKMLEDKGLPPLSYPAILLRQMKVNSLKAAQAKPEEK